MITMAMMRVMQMITKAVVVFMTAPELVLAADNQNGEAKQEDDKGGCVETHGVLLG